MRESKFRGKSVRENVWVYGCYFEQVESVGVVSYIRSPTFSFEIVPESVGQFTELKDKNSVEIYEGDRVMCYLENPITPDVVEFKNAAFWLRHRDIPLCYWEGEFEVVGNIFDA